MSQIWLSIASSSVRYSQSRRESLSLPRLSKTPQASTVTAEGSTLEYSTSRLEAIRRGRSVLGSHLRKEDWTLTSRWGEKEPGQLLSQGLEGQRRVRPNVDQVPHHHSVSCETAGKSPLPSCPLSFLLLRVSSPGWS